MSYRIEDLQVKNFGMIEDFQCNQFSNINLIIGENGTGKTFLLKALYSAVKALEEYKRGDLTVEELDRNIAEQQQILLNAFFEGETKSVYCNAVVDAHQFVRSLIIQGKLTVENQ